MSVSTESARYAYTPAVKYVHYNHLSSLTDSQTNAKKIQVPVKCHYSSKIFRKNKINGICMEIPVVRLQMNYM